MSLGTDSANLRNLRTQRVGGASVLFGALFLVSVALAAAHSPFEGVSSEGETGLVGQSGVAQASSWEIDVPAPGVLPPCRPGDVVLVGDSLTVGMQAVGGGEDGIEYIAGGGWRFEHGLLMLTGRLALSGVTTLPENTELVVHLGSNGWGDGDPDEMLAKFVEVAPAHLEHLFVLALRAHRGEQAGAFVELLDQLALFSVATMKS